jgi:hypothetical protein
MEAICEQFVRAESTELCLNNLTLPESNRPLKGNPFTFAAPSLLGIGRVSGTGELDGKKPPFTMDLGPSGMYQIVIE